MTRCRVGDMHVLDRHHNRGGLSQATDPAPDKTITLVANFPQPSQARQMFDRIEEQAPSTASARLFSHTVFLVLPAGQPALRSDWFDRLHAGSSDTFVAGKTMRAHLTLSCAAPDDATASAIEQEATEFFEISSGMKPIPPWANDSRRAAHRIARQTYKKLRSAGVTAYRDP